MILTTELTRLCIVERFYSIAEDEQIRHTKEIEAAKEKRMEWHAQQFRALVNERKEKEEEKQITDKLTLTGLQTALKIVRIAQKTGWLSESEELP